MALYAYPYDEFARDYDAICAPLNAATRTFAHHLHTVRDYINATYTEQLDRIERGAALNMIATFLQRHMPEFDTGRIAVRGSPHNMISEHLLRALHALICPFCFGNVANMPEPSEVIALAEQLAHEESKNERS